MTDREIGWGKITLIGGAAGQYTGHFNATRSGNALTIIFDDLGLDLQKPDAPHVGLASFAFEVPLVLPRQRGLFGVFASLRGDVVRTTGARAMLLVAVGNAAKVLDYPYGQSAPAETGGELATGVNALFSIDHWPTDTESRGVAQPRPPMLVSLTLLAQRKTAEDGVLAQIDSLDISAATYDGGSSGGTDDLDV
jgi:hypothetical protein